MEEAISLMDGLIANISLKQWNQVVQIWSFQAEVEHANITR